MPIENNNLDIENHVAADETFRIVGSVLNDMMDIIKDLKTEITNLNAQSDIDELADLRLRDKNPALKDAWDQYQSVRALVEK